MRYDAIVIGSGAAGLFTALQLREHGSVVLVTKAELADANTNWAQGGIAAAVGALDSPEQHLRDTIAAGAGLVDEEAARVLCDEGPGCVAELLRRGVHFDVERGQLALAREAAHSQARVLHAGGDQTGAEIERALAAESVRRGLEIHTRAFVTRILVEAGRAAGVELLVSGELATVESGTVILATGGAGQLYRFTTNPAVATADGIALAFRAGAEVADLEFFQFHPTALRVDGQRPFLISEAVRGEGAILRNAGRQAFMASYHERAELAPRDVVARSILAEMKRTGTDHVYLDCTGIEGVDLAERFPAIFAFCSEAGIDIRREPIPVAPAAHYYMGGVRTDTWGRTTIEGLHACGEAACTGIHGANRLASNSLLESIVFAKRVAQDVMGGDRRVAPPSADAITAAAPAARLGRGELQQLLWDDAGIERTGEGLARAAGHIDAAPLSEPPATEEEHEHANLTLVGRLLIEAAMRRTESRGAHFRLDYPGRDDAAWKRRQVFHIGR